MKSIFGKGTYFIGDICYALDENIYDYIWGKKYEYENGEFKVGKSKFVVASTAYGDGCYEGTDGCEYGVDAGVIGIVPEVLWDEKRTDEEKPSMGFSMGGRVVEVKKELIFEVKKQGVFVITLDGKEFTINTR